MGLVCEHYQESFGFFVGFEDSLALFNDIFCLYFLLEVLKLFTILLIVAFYDLSKLFIVSHLIFSKFGTIESFYHDKQPFLEDR